MPNLEFIINLVIEGQLADAEIACREHLRIHPKDASAYNILGGILSRLQQTDAAIAALHQAITLDPLSPKAFHNLGCIYAAQGNTVESIGCFKKALATEPTFLPSHQSLSKAYKAINALDAAVPHYQFISEHTQAPEAGLDFAEILVATKQIDEAKRLIQRIRITPPLFTRLGTLQLEIGNPSSAEVFFEKAIEHDPSDALAYNNLGVSRLRQYRANEAIPAIRHALELSPNEPNFHFSLGCALMDAGEAAQAITLLEHALIRWPDRVAGLTNLGLALIVERQPISALPPLIRAHELDPNDPETCNNIGIAYEALGEYVKAEEYLHQALALEPSFARPYNNLGNIALAQMHLDLAKERYQKALELNSSLPDPKMNLGLVNLLQGNMSAGWRGYEWRQHTLTEKDKARNFPLPRWQGEELAGKRILLHAEQGFGDTIQFIRYAPLVKARGGQVIVLCQSPLKRLLVNAAGIDFLVDEKDPLPDFDVHLPMLSLPSIFDTQISTIPSGTGSYLTPAATSVLYWRDALAAEPRKKIGLVWAGSPKHRNNRNRSCTLKDFLPLLTLAGCAFYSLQKGEPAKELLELAIEHRLRITDYTDRFSDFADTAAFIKNLDLVICVDTAVAHLTGAIGTPVWVLLPFSPDWRWLTNRQDSPWYGSAHLFRQSETQNWEEVLTQVSKSLGIFETTQTNTQAGLDR